MSEEEKWDMFFRYTKQLEQMGLSRQQFEDAKMALEQLLWEGPSQSSNVDY